MEVDQLETFLAVLTYGGFHRAAGALNVSQPAVSGRIRALEDSLGAKLFARDGVSLSLSPAGKALRPHAEQVLRTVALARQAVYEEIRPSAGGVLRVAATLAMCTYFIPSAVVDFHAEFPKVLLSVRRGSSAEVLKLVLGGEADLGLACSLKHPEVETLTLRNYPLVLVGHPAQRQTRQRNVRLEDVESWPLILYDRGSNDWTLTQGLFHRSGLLPNVALEVESIQAAKGMVQRKLGLSFLPMIAISEDLRKGKLVAIDIVNSQRLRRTLDVIYPRHRPLTLDAQAFLQLVKTAAAKTGPE